MTGSSGSRYGSRTLISARIRPFVGRLSWGVADQALSSLTNFAVGIVVARSLGIRELGAFSIAFATYLGVHLFYLGGVVTDPSFPLEDGDVQIHSTVLAYARAVDVWGTSGKFDVVLPFAWVSGTATFRGQPREREVSGLAASRLLACPRQSRWTV